jgi:acetyl-CoA carboxylase carboxyltransferase component
MADRVVPADGIIIGYGKVDGRPVAAFAEDFTCMGGTFGERHGKKMNKIIEFGMRNNMPVVGLNDSGGARLQENMGPLSEYGKLFYLNSVASGVVPQIAVLLGPVAGGQAYSPGLNDFLIMARNAAVTFIAGPPLVKAVTGEEIDAQSLGGPDMHASVSGTCHLVCEDDEEALERTRELLGYLPSSNRRPVPVVDTGDDPERRCEGVYDIVPDERDTPYDMHDVIAEIVDNGEIFEIHRDYARSMIVCFARLGGKTVGIYANNPLVVGGAIDVPAAEKAARFIRFCDAFNIPVLSLVDTPAYLIGSTQEKLGIIYKGAKLLHAISEATVPQITVYIGKAYAGGYLAMGSKDFRIDYVFAWPTASIALVGPKGTVNVIYGKELAAVEDKTERAELRARREKEFADTYMNIYYPASLQHIDDIIDPADTRRLLIRAYESLEEKKMDLPWRKHGNIPL